MVQVYFPNDLIKLCKKSKEIDHFLIGYKFNRIYIVIQLLDTAVDFNKLPSHLSDLKIIGSISNSDKPVDNDYDLHLSFDTLPYFKSSVNDSFIILFDPPKFRNLEYFSIEPILLQSTGRELLTSDQASLINKLNVIDPITESPNNDKNSFISDDIILEKINLSLKVRLELKAWMHENSENQSHNYHSVDQVIQNKIINVIVFLVSLLQTLIIFLIWLINYQIKSVSLVSISKVFRQLDLRLQQLNYFPIQFLCYYNKNLLYGGSKLLYELKLPIFNSNLNINNSNYINLFNTLWLIFNDIMFGITAYRLIFDNYERIIPVLHEGVIQKYLFSEMLDVISWVSVKHPAGFKLNIKLGHFMGDLYSWTLKFWKFLVNDSIQNLSPDFKFKLFIAVKIFLKILCYGGGLSFLIGFCIDIINALTVHIYCFYYTSTKIYKRQLDIIKSLFQLFRGKKYNVLRNRIDNLNNYEDDDSSLEIDQLLLGTLLFMILILLLPTVFAFYLMFFLMQLTVLLAINFLENLQILVNFTPMFVILLKLKNSNRLQGGIIFTFLKMSNHSSYLKLSNKSLSYSEIFRDFFKIFTDSKTFRDTLIQFFLQGELISIKHNYEMKFHYLMLPEVYEKTINIWKYF
ncbi:glycosylphosphatidylinositol synthesis N-acetylglucosaminyltransferase complex, subunit PIG-Q/GPI1 [Scheffersomyces coipomensis]|uniref:glycosylphosphatidylinositol synthesis N-acetylglucosaminyltransferase complex, subunit PIG-Q/GPI1 n=1 Tax=Scheffersomyces coipomensis TaxID=1788519 RepID=UPI00315D045F